MDLSPSTLFWTASAALFAFAFVCALAERLRARRANLDRPGMVPWHLLQIVAFILAVAGAALALKV